MSQAAWRLRALRVSSGLLLLLLSGLSASDAIADDIERSAISGGAVESAGASYSIRGTIGEAGVVGRSVGASYSAGQGFWAGHYRLVATGAPDLGGGVAVAAWTDGLQQNLPNPFRFGTSIAYSVGRPSPVRLAVYDISGRRVATLTDSNQEPGLYRVDWEGRDGSGNRVASGVYFYRLDIGSWSSTRKLLKLQ